jgi:E3 ubiquitin-protein ligase UBR4
LTKKLRFLNMFTHFSIRSHVQKQVPATILSALIKCSWQLLDPPQDGTGFPELVSIMATLATAGGGAGHVQLMKAAVRWLKKW